MKRLGNERKQFFDRLTAVLLSMILCMLSPFTAIPVIAPGNGVCRGIRMQSIFILRMTILLQF